MTGDQAPKRRVWYVAEYDTGDDCDWETFGDRASAVHHAKLWSKRAELGDVRVLDVVGPADIEDCDWQWIDADPGDILRRVYYARLHVYPDGWEEPADPAPSVIPAEVMDAVDRQPDPEDVLASVVEILVSPTDWSADTFDELAGLLLATGWASSDGEFTYGPRHPKHAEPDAPVRF